MTTATTGTGTITLGSAVAGYQTFAAAGAQNADLIYYTIEDGTAWEIGLGSYSTTGPTLSRSLLQSSTGSRLNLSGSAQVFISAPAEAVQSGVDITGGLIRGIADLAVADGGTGVSSFTPYGIVLGGTTDTGALQNVSGLGTSGQVLTSTGAGAAPTWQTLTVPARNFRAQLFTSSGNWTAPAGITSLRVLAIGAGGGGAGFVSSAFRGGFGGVVLAMATVSPGTTYTVTVGAGGTGSNTANGGNGGDSSFDTIATATGGVGATTTAAGTHGSGSVGTGGTLLRSGSIFTNGVYQNVNAGVAAAGPFIGEFRAAATTSTAAIAFDPAVDLCAGSGGAGETAASDNNATGGVGGLVYIEWVE